MKKLLKKIFPRKLDSIEIIGLPDGCRLYCIGDIHGRLDLLQQVHQKIIEHADGYAGNKWVVYIGDYVDRGPHSKQVVDYLLENPLSKFKSVYLLGNHEQTLLQFIYGNNIGLAFDWFRFGGIATLQSYGVTLNGIPTIKNIDGLRAEFRDKCPDQHKLFYQNLQLSFELGGYYFVHAGVKPRVAFDKQNPDDLLWIREEFINSKFFHGKIVIHGHTVTEQPDVRPNRIGVDTGAYASGILTCAVFEGLEFDFI